MNYNLIYNNLITKCRLLHDIRLQEKRNGIYFENHHILPRCMGGVDDAINLVYLTPEEHFLAHRLLIRVYPNVYDLYLSVQIMIGNGKYTKNNKSYGRIKRMIQDRKRSIGMPQETREKISNTRKGIIFSDEHCAKISESRLGKSWEELMGEARAAELRISRSAPRQPTSDQTKKKISESKKGIRPHAWTDESKQKVSKSMIGKRKSEGQKAKLKEYNEIIKICPHCEKSGSGPSMQRWHFTNCKKKC